MLCEHIQQHDNFHKYHYEVISHPHALEEIPPSATPTPQELAMCLVSKTSK